MNILVTGGAGFIASHIAGAYLDEGHRVTVLDNLSTGVRDNIPDGAEFIQLDIRDPGVEQVFKQKKFDLVSHHAAQIDVRVSVKDPVEDVKVNVGGSVALLENCRKYGVSSVIFASTGGAIYGEQDYFPADEEHPTRPISPYGVAKLAVERYMFFYHVEYGLNCTALRYANVYGPRQNPFGEAGVVAIFCRKLLDGEQPFVNGDGLQTRDYVYVEDVMRANRAALGLDGFNIVNVGTGVETDVNRIFDTLNRLTGGKFQRQHCRDAPGEQRRSCLDPTLAGTLLNWQPHVELDRGLEQTLDYFSGHRR